jgi:hypothetical protein
MFELTELSVLAVFIFGYVLAACLSVVGVKEPNGSRDWATILFVTAILGSVIDAFLGFLMIYSLV